jgi:Transmembrane protein 131-like N-terminal
MTRVPRRGNAFYVFSIAIMIGSIVSFGYVSAAAGQSRVIQKWVERIDLPAGSSFAYTITADAEGNVYIGGSDCVSNNGEGSCTRNDLQIEKYAASGERLWGGSLRSAGDEALASAIAVDSSGNVYVTGGGETGVVEGGLEKQTEFITIKYNSSGVRQWIAEFVTGTDANAGGLETYGLQGASPVGIKVDSAGNSYISGVDYPDGGNPSITTIKYSPTGQQLWVEQQLGIPAGMALDSSGDVYATGEAVTSNDATFNGAITIKYNSSGTKLWQQTLSQNTANTAIALDGSGNAYVAGYSHSSTTTDAVNAYVVKYSASGTQEFNTPYQGSSTAGNVPLAISVDSSGNSYVAGYTVTIYGTKPTPPQVPNGFDTLKFSASGTFDWERIYNGGQNSNQAAAVFVNNEDDVYATGSNGTDYVTIKYDPSGNQLWVATYSGPAPGASATGIAASGGNLYVTGNSTATDGLEGWATIEYVQDAAVFSPSSLTFAARAVGTASAAQSVTLTNSSSSEDLDIRGLDVAEPFSQTNNCSSVLAPGGSCTFRVTYTPTATGTQAGSVSLYDQWAGSPAVITLNGRP